MTKKFIAMPTILKQKGSALLFTILLVGIMLAIVFVLSNIFAGKVRTVFELNASLRAIFAADSGIESCLYHVRILALSVDTCPGVTVAYSLSNGATFRIVVLSPSSIRSIGAYRGVQRALEINGVQ